MTKPKYGKEFYECLTVTSGIKLINFENFNNNTFHVTTELQIAGCIPTQKFANIIFNALVNLSESADLYFPYIIFYKHFLKSFFA